MQTSAEIAPVQRFKRSGKFILLPADDNFSKQQKKECKRRRSAVFILAASMSCVCRAAGGRSAQGGAQVRRQLGEQQPGGGQHRGERGAPLQDLDEAGDSWTLPSANTHTIWAGLVVVPAV